MIVQQYYLAGDCFLRSVESGCAIADAVVLARRKLSSWEWPRLPKYPLFGLKSEQALIVKLDAAKCHVNFQPKNESKNGKREVCELEPISNTSEISLILCAESAAAIRNRCDREVEFRILLGMLVARYWRIKYCACCGWRMVARPSGIKHCPVCAYKEGESAAEHLRQRKTYKAMLGSEAYKNFEFHRDLGLYFPLRRALGQAELVSNALPVDPWDFTSDEAYQQAKKKLAEEWAVCQVNQRRIRAQETEAALFELAREGVSRAKAAKALGISRAAVTKACARNPDLAVWFDAED